MVLYELSRHHGAAANWNLHMLSYWNGPDNTAHVRAECKDVITFLHILLKLGLIRHVIQESYISLELGDH